MTYKRGRKVRTATVESWTSEGLCLVTTEDDPNGALEVHFEHPSDLERVDAEVDTDSELSGFFVEVDGPATVVVQSVGTRDVVIASSTGAHALPGPASFMRTDVSGTQSRPAVRDWMANVRRILDSLDMQQRDEVIRSQVRAPILERVLQEAVLPRTLERLVLVATDQADAELNGQDTVDTAAVLVHWLEANGHMYGIGEPDQSRRWVREVVVETITHVPHIIDAVAHRLKRSVDMWADGAERLVVVQGGGTPGMNMGVLIAATQHTDVPVRLVQVPEPRRGSGRLQALVEADLRDLPELGGALGR